MGEGILYALWRTRSYIGFIRGDGESRPFFPRRASPLASVLQKEAFGRGMHVPGVQVHVP